MKNIVTASVHFSFKGKELSPSLVIELDPHLEASGALPNLCTLIATQNGFDLYSYEYEMMQAAEIKFSNPQGLVEKYIIDSNLNIEDFIKAWQEGNALIKMLEITEQHMNISNFENHTELKYAILAAYELGQQDAKNRMLK